MRVRKNRWGEVTTKKQGTDGKNDFDSTKSFSIDKADKNYTLLQYWNILKLVTNLTEKFDYEKLKEKLSNL